MEKRFVLFIVLSLGVLTSYALLKTWFGPEKPEVVNQQGLPENAAQDSDGHSDGQDPKKKTATEEDEKTAPSPPDQPPEPATEPPTPAPTTETDIRPETDQPAKWPDRWISFGTYQPGAGTGPGPNPPQSATTSPPILVTANARGGTIERLELTERGPTGKLRYRELLDRSGYLGHLAPTPDPSGGCRVNVVGHGTPAALAKDRASPKVMGLQVGDVIHHIDSTPISSPASLKSHLKTTKPGQPVQIGVHRPTGESFTDHVLTATLSVHPLQLIQPERPLKTDSAVALHPSSFLFSLLQVDDERAEKGSRELALDRSLRNDNWQLAPTPNGQGVEFRMQVTTTKADGVPVKLELIKRFRLGHAKDGDAAGTPYHLDYDIEIKNLSDQPHQIAYRQDGPNGLPLEGWWYSNKLHPTMFYVAGARDIVWKTELRNSDEIRVYDHELRSCSELHKTATKAKEGKSPETVLFASDAKEIGDRMPLYVAVDTQYFVTAFKPVSEQQEVYDLAAGFVLGKLANIPKAAEKSTNVSFHLDSHPRVIESQGTFKQSFEVYAGPKIPELLAAYDLQDCIYYGWFSTVSKLLAIVLHFFFAIVNNYGLAIILLTVLVRSGMFPLSRKAAKNAAMMQALAPQMKKITEKYKEDMEKRAKAQQDLFKKHNYNPFGGCWMMFLQLPIFIGLYRCLSVDINLRQAALIPGITWCSNLAGPDMMFPWPGNFTWSIFTEMGMLGPYFNILPMFTVALFLVQQKLFTPPPTDDQSRMQLTMMKYMTVFIGVMFFKVAAGLCLYFIASSLWGIAERKLLPKPKLAADGGPPSEPLPAKPKPKPRPKPRLPDNGKSGRPQSRPKKKRR